MAINCVIGIDPGAAGGIVIWRPGHRINAVRMPKEMNDINKLFEYYKSTTEPIIFLEKLQLHHGDMDVPGKAFRMQSMLAGFEQLKAYIEVNDIPYAMVHPMKWQNALKLRQKGVKESKQDRKNRFKRIAGELYGEIKQSLWSSDATLIMHFGRYMLKNEPKWILENVPKRLHEKLLKKNQ